MGGVGEKARYFRAQTRNKLGPLTPHNSTLPILKFKLENVESLLKMMWSGTPVLRIISYIRENKKALKIS
jgi:hypothetical protein